MFMPEKVEEVRHPGSKRISQNSQNMHLTTNHQLQSTLMTTLYIFQNARPNTIEIFSTPRLTLDDGGFVIRIASHPDATTFGF
jgi:hypothetical protein